MLCLSEGRIPHVHVLKVAHHGSDNGSTREWVLATRPTVAIVSVGARNAFGHPAFQVEELWRSSGASVYRTDYFGDIEIRGRADGTFEVKVARNAPIKVAK